jgi:lipoprotein-anchoring transpeptidase ErfK/SrfK
MRTLKAILALLLIQSAFGAEAHKRGRQRQPVPQPVSYDAATINQPDQPEIAKGAKGSPVVRAQTLLSRAHFSVGEIDGAFGRNMVKALAGYQAEKKLPASGNVDAATWAALNADTAPVLMEYIVTPEDAAGAFVAIPKHMKEQAKLPRMGYTSLLEALAERAHASPKLIRALNSAAGFAGAGEKITMPNAAVMPPGQAAKVVVSKSESSVRAYDADGHLLAFYPATAGSTHDPLPIGDWKINGISRNPKFHYNPKLFWDAKPTDEKAVIAPGPNNPVGVVWIDLSKEHYGIHGTPEPSRIGYTYSHGCIRLTNWDAAELAEMVKPGTPAVLKE